MIKEVAVNRFYVVIFIHLLSLGYTKHSTKLHTNTGDVIQSTKMRWNKVHSEGGPKRVNHAAVVVGHTIYSFGGYCKDENYLIERPIDVHILHPETKRWKVLTFKSSPSVPFQRYGHTCVAYDRFIYLWGGGNNLTVCNDLYRFDTKTLTWSKPEVSGYIPRPLINHSAVIIRNKMYIFGGYITDLRIFSQDVYTLDLNTLIWSFVPTKGPSPFNRYLHTATAYLDRYMIIFGGRGDLYSSRYTSSKSHCNIIFWLDVETQEWLRPKTMGDEIPARRSHSAFMYEGFLYIGFGCNGWTNKYFNDFYRYDPKTGEWKIMLLRGEGPTPRRRQGCVTLDNRVFFFGGTSSIRLADRSDAPYAELNEEVIQNDDMFFLDMAPNLISLCFNKIIREKLDISSLPNALKEEIARMKKQNKILPISGG